MFKSDKMKVLLVFNSHAGRGHAGKMLPEIKTTLINHGPEITKDQMADFSILELHNYVQNEIVKLVEKP